MGQYYRFLNIDKKQICDRNKGDLKLTEHSYYKNEYCSDILSLLENEWKGDRIIHVGDYAEEKDGTRTASLISKIKEENNVNTSIYNWADMLCDVAPYDSNNKIRYVYNHDKKEYIDLWKQPIQWFHCEKNKIIPVRFNSFALLTACGNGQGGGDYRAINENKIGSWAGDHFTSSDKELEEYKDYKLNNYIFNEQLHLKNSIKKWNDKSEKEIVKAECKSLVEHLKIFLDYENINIEKASLEKDDMIPLEYFYFLSENVFQKCYEEKKEDKCLEN